MIVLTIEGNNLQQLYSESGNIKLQRVPPTERNGRVHTSMITVAVINPEKDQFSSDDKDIRIEWYSGSGSGGQNRNKTQNCCRLIHIPTGTIKTAQSRDRESSYKHAHEALMQELQAVFHAKQNAARNQTRVEQIQVSNGDARTFRFRDDRVVDHRTGKTVRCKDIMKGNFNLLWS